jgi:Family of unknown function (DUF5906)/Bifunctional DNA primase/polymerase, N-terminal
MSTVNLDIDADGVNQNHGAKVKNSSPAASPYGQVGARLVEMGYSAIPILDGDKRPGHNGFGTNDWRKFEHRLPSQEGIQKWSMVSAHNGVGVILGGPHFLKAADLDTDDAEINDALMSVFPTCTVIKRGQKGCTRFYRGTALPLEKFQWKKDSKSKAVFELLGSGQQTVVPGSIHPDTKAPYRWIGPDDLEDVPPTDLTDLPANFIEQVDSVLEPLGYTRGKAEPKADPNAKTKAAPDAGGGPWRDLNEQALAHLSDWVPELGLPKCKRKSNGGYEATADWRLSGEGRPLEKRKTNLKIDPKGIVDFGGDKYTAIDLVMVAKGCDECAAFLWLDDRLNPKPNAGTVGAPDDDDVSQEGEHPSPAELKKRRILAKAEKAAVLDEMNSQYMVVSEGGQALIYRDVMYETLGRRIYESMKPASFGLLYRNRKIVTRFNDDGTTKKKGVAEFWLDHKDRRQFIKGVIFDPTTTESKGGHLNLWRGYSVEPKAGNWGKYKSHMLDIVCGGNKAHFDYLIGWCARLIQHPELPGEVAVVLRGSKGAGKGTFVNALLYLIRQHGLHLTNSNHLVGRFNEHLKDCVLLFADEAFFAGDKQGEGTLKALITERVLFIEGKFKTPQQFPNRLHVIMASNNEWVVPATEGERRYFVLDVSDARAQDHVYFGAILDELKMGGYEAMLYDLMHLDISKFNVRRVPETDALEIQKLHNLPTERLWWQDVLYRRYVFESKLGLEEYFGDWHEWCSTEVLFRSYSEFAKAKGERRPVDRKRFGEFMHKMGALPARERHGVVGEHMIDAQGLGRRAELIERATGYQLGTLDRAREVFDPKRDWETNFEDDE